MSAIKEVKNLQAATRQRVLDLLNWNDLQYGTFQMEQAYGYLNHIIPDDAWGKNHLPHTATFWAWWRNHWYKRDVQFLEYAEGLSAKKAVLFYEVTHTPEAIEFTPHSVILEDAYAKMVYEVTHKESVC